MQDPRDTVYGGHGVGLDMLDFLLEFLEGASCRNADNDVVPALCQMSNA